MAAKNGTDTITTTFRLPRDLDQALRQKAKVEDRSLNNYVVKTLRDSVGSGLQKALTR